MKAQEFGDLLKSQFLPKFLYIQADIEGYDIRILNTLSNVIAERRPVIKAEVTSIRIQNSAKGLSGPLRNIFTSFIRRMRRIALGEQLLGKSNQMNWPDLLFTSLHRLFPWEAGSPKL